MIRYLGVLLLWLSVICFQGIPAAVAEDCMGLVYAIRDCSAYMCVTQFHDEQVKYEVLGLSGEHCKYSEADASGFALCSVSKENFAAVSNYLVQLLTKSNKVNIDAVARLKADTCRFYRTLGNSLVKREKELSKPDVKIFERIVEMRIRREETQEIESMFFSKQDLKELGLDKPP